MRTICSLLDLNEINFSYEDVNVFKNENGVKCSQSDPGFNPSGYSVPTLADNDKTIIADGPTLYKYLCYTKSL
jgi:hypothetical protein